MKNKYKNIVYFVLALKGMGFYAFAGEETYQANDVITIQVDRITFNANQLFSQPLPPLPPHIKVVGYDIFLKNEEETRKRKINDILDSIQKQAMPYRQDYHEIGQFVEQGKWEEAFNLMKEKTLFDKEDANHPGTKILREMEFIPSTYWLVRSLLD